MYLQGYRELLSIAGSMTSTVWIKGKLNVIADALSKVSPQDVEPNIEQESPIFAVNTLTNFQEGEEKMALMEETVKDSELSALHNLISEEWPPKRSSVPDNLKDYWNYYYYYWDYCMMENGKIYPTDRLPGDAACKERIHF